MNKTIEILIAPDGTARVETKGFTGAACRAASRLIEQALGQQTNEQLKAKSHQSTPTQQPLRQGE